MGWGPRWSGGQRPGISHPHPQAAPQAENWRPQSRGMRPGGGRPVHTGRVCEHVCAWCGCTRVCCGDPPGWRDNPSRPLILPLLLPQLAPGLPLVPFSPSSVQPGWGFHGVLIKIGIQIIIAGSSGGQVGGRRGWEGGWRRGRSWMGGSYPHTQAPAASHWLFFFFLQMYLKCMEFSPKPSSCCLATVMGPAVPSYRRVDSSLVPVLEQGPELSKPAGGGEGLVQSSGPMGQWH